MVNTQEVLVSAQEVLVSAQEVLVSGVMDNMLRGVTGRCTAYWTAYAVAGELLDNDMLWKVNIGSENQYWA